MKNDRALILQQELYADICKASLYEFVLYFWDVIVPDPFIDNWHIKYICDELQIVAERIFKRLPKEYDLIINVPPGTSKSTICTIMFPAWCWVNDPTLKFITGSYSASLSSDHGMKSRDVLKSEKFNTLYPDLIEFKKDQDLKQSYQNTANGGRMSTGIGGAATGFHGHILTIDDPNNPKQAGSRAVLKTSCNWLTSTLSTRTVSKELTVMILIMQRLAEDDPTGYLLDIGGPIRHICLPAEITDLDNVRPRSAEQYYKDGLLDPNRMNRNVLAAQRKRLGSREYTGQFLQNPVASEGNLFKRSWWKWYDHLMDARYMLRVHSWDTAHKKGQENDFSVCTVWDVYPEGAYLIYGWAEKVNYPELKAQAILINSLYPATHIIVEDKSSGQDLVPDLLATTTLPVKAVMIRGDKVSRASTCSAYVEAGNVFLPNDDEFAAKLVEQCAGFPNLKHDDIVDSTTLFINWLRDNAPASIEFSSTRRDIATKLTHGYTENKHSNHLRTHTLTKGYR